MQTTRMRSSKCMLVLVTLSECLPKIWKQCNFQYMLVCSSEQVLRMPTDGPLTEREQNRYGMGVEWIQNRYGMDKEQEWECESNGNTTHSVKCFM